MSRARPNHLAMYPHTQTSLQTSAPQNPPSLRLGVGVYWQALTRRLPLLLVTSFAAAIVAYGFAGAIHPSYQVHFSYLVSLRDREPSEAFRFDGYYALQATDLFAATLASWAKTPEIIVAAHQQAGLALTTLDPRSVGQLVLAQKTAPQLVEIVVKQPTEEQAKQLAQGLQRVMETEVARYHEQGIPALAFQVVPTQPWVGRPRVATNIIAITVFVIVLIIGINVVLFIESFRIDSK